MDSERVIGLTRGGFGPGRTVTFVVAGAMMSTWSTPRGFVPMFCSSTVSVTRGFPFPDAVIVLTALNTCRGLKSATVDDATALTDVAAAGVTSLAVEL